MGPWALGNGQGAHRTEKQQWGHARQLPQEARCAGDRHQLPGGKPRQGERAVRAGDVQAVQPDVPSIHGAPAWWWWGGGDAVRVQQVQ
jgi:hypothetical protein